MLGVKLSKIIPTLIFLYRTYDKVPDKKLNGTFTKEAAAESESYDMTPSRDELPPQPSKDEENYGIEDLHSDEVMNVIQLFFNVMASGGLYSSIYIRDVVMCHSTLKYIFSFLELFTGVAAGGT